MQTIARYLIFEIAANTTFQLLQRSNCRIHQQGFLHLLHEHLFSFYQADQRDRVWKMNFSQLIGSAEATPAIRQYPFALT